MKTVKFIIPLFIILLCWSCQSDADDQQLSDEMISLNLAENGKADRELLIGDWDLVSFAYTKDGKKMSNVTAVSGGRLSVPFAPTPADHHPSERWRLGCINSIWFICSISGNNIELELRGTTFAGVPTPHLEHDITFAFANANSFAIKNDELIIFFKMVKDKDLLSFCTVIENKNLIIFKKR